MDLCSNSVLQVQPHQQVLVLGLWPREQDWCQYSARHWQGRRLLAQVDWRPLGFQDPGPLQGMRSILIFIIFNFFCILFSSFTRSRISPLSHPDRSVPANFVLIDDFRRASVLVPPPSRPRLVLSARTSSRPPSAATLPSRRLPTSLRTRVLPRSSAPARSPSRPKDTKHNLTKWQKKKRIKIEKVKLNFPSFAARLLSFFQRPAEP